MPNISLRPAIYLRLGCAVAALAAAYACDSRTPTAPAPVLTPPSLRGDESEGTLLGSIDLAPGTGFSQFGAIPENKWALIRVSGKWIVKPNPGCADQPPNWPCIMTDAYSSFASGYPDAFAGPVQVSTYSPTGSRDDVPLRAFGSADEGIGLTLREFSRSVWAGPVLRNPTVQQFGNSGPSVPSYIFDGSYSVTVTEIASPIRVTEGAAEADGSRTYTVEPLHGLQLINPEGSSLEPPGAVRWFFVPGEDVDPVAPNSDPPWTINECRNLTACRWTPPGPGRVQVSASVETRRARARSSGGDTPVPQEPKLVLTCNGGTDSVSVVRTDSVRCVASPQPTGAQLRVTGWTFEGGGQTIARDSASAQQAQWTGMMVVSGKISVAGTVNGSASSASAIIAVTERQWTETVPPVIGPHTQGCASHDRATRCFLKYPPDRPGELGVTVPFGGSRNLPNRAAHVADGGPNKGFSYVGGSTSPIVIDSLVIYMNKVFYDPQDDFWRNATCPRVPLLEWSIRHEQFHAQLVREAVARGLANGVSLEAMVRFIPLAQMREYLRTEGEQAFRDYLHDAGDRNHVLHRWETTPCRLSEMFPSPQSA
jgi:hypothetical protein